MSEVRFEETDRGPALDNGILRIEVHLNKGTFDIVDVASGRITVRDAAVTVALRDGPTLTSRGEGMDFAGTDDVEDAQGSGCALRLGRETYEEEPEVQLSVALYGGQPFAVLQAEIQNVRPGTIRVQSLRPLDGGVIDPGVEPGDLRFYKHGWQSWSPTVVLDCAGEDIAMSPPVVAPGTQPQAKPGRFVSELMTTIVEPQSGSGVVAGFISTANQFSHVYFDRDSRTITAASHGDGVKLGPKGLLASERLYVEATVSPVEAMCRYGDAVGREMDAVQHDRVASGWCSWYYYWQGVTEAEVIANLDFLTANRQSLPFDYVQIDDGYQTEIGDWLTVNEKFPKGMKWLADRIHDAGFKAGIWVAPFLAGARSRLLQEHPDWFVKFTTGNPAIATMNWGQLCFALDTTHPEVLAWLRGVFRTICHEWGYDYVKIDFIFAAAVDGVRYDPTATRAQAYRRGVETIREAVGSRFVLACGNPQGPSVGLVDGARVGPDVAPYWRPFDRAAPRDPMSDPSALNSIRNSILRFWMHGRLWANDPDCLLVRETDIALTEAEVQTLTTVIGMTGGMVLDSDNLPKVSPERLRLISLLLPVYGKSALPADMFLSLDVPRVLELDCGSHRLLALFNWDDSEATVSGDVPQGAWHAFEFWSREYLGVFKSTVEVHLPAHGCALLRLTRDAGRPTVVGSTLHITQGATEIASEEWGGDNLRVHLRPVANKEGQIYVWSPGGLQTLEIENLTAERTIDV